MKNLQRSVIFGTLVLSFSAVAHAQNSAPSTPIRPEIKAPQPINARLELLVVRPSKDKYLGGEPIVLTLTLINNSAKTASFLMLDPKSEFAIKNNQGLNRGKGKLVPLSSAGRDKSAKYQFGERILLAGQNFEYKIILSRYFDMSRAGDYTISCTKRLKNENREPGGNLIGPLILSKDLKISVSSQDLDTFPLPG